MNIDELVEEFYRMQTSNAEIALLIGDADTLSRLRSAQRRYIIDLFSGVYDLEYVNNRLRIGLVHKRIGVEPKLYLSAIYLLKDLIQKLLKQLSSTESEYQAAVASLDKLIMYDITLVFDTYIRSLVSEIETAKEKSEHYARSLEEKVQSRTRQLEEMSHTDPLTGLLNIRHFESIISTTLYSAQRRSEPVTLIYIDIDDFKAINDTFGHQRGDEVLRLVANAIKSVARAEDFTVRYGGDEFCMLLSNLRAEQAQDLIVTRLEHTMNKTLEHVTLSIGIAQTGPDEYIDAFTLINLADKNMYSTKEIHKTVKH
jgi:diguanylate cyclase (GGDEF)-like protein